MDETKIDKALNFFGFYNSFNEIQKTWSLDEFEMQELRVRAKERYGESIFSD